jgi:cytochrome c oxidase subunit 1
MNPEIKYFEWTAPMEHIHGNWPGEIPEVHRWPYDYSNPNHDEDFVPQNVPMKPGEEVYITKIFKKPYEK